MTGGVASTVSRRHAPDSQSRRRGIRRGLMIGLFDFWRFGAEVGRAQVAARAYTIYCAANDFVHMRKGCHGRRCAHCAVRSVHAGCERATPMPKHVLFAAHLHIGICT
jgi:hypothetical protein